MKIGIDIGGSHIAVGLIGKMGKLFAKEERDIQIEENNEKNKEYILKEIIDAIDLTLNLAKVNISEIEVIGIAVPGTVSDTHIIKAENLHIKNFNIVSEINKYYNVPIKLRNDAKCAAIAEKEYGTLRKVDDAIFLCLGTGIGGAVFLNGNLLKPKKYEGFELGHVVIQKDGNRCNCGRQGCFETYASMRVLKEKLAKELNTNRITVEILKENLEKENIKKIIDSYIEYLSIGIANLINIFEPEVISIGGSFVYYKDILLDKLAEKLKNNGMLFNEERLPKIITAKLKNDAGMIGAIL